MYRFYISPCFWETTCSCVQWAGQTEISMDTWWSAWSPWPETALPHCTKHLSKSVSHSTLLCRRVETCRLQCRLNIPIITLKASHNQTMCTLVCLNSMALNVPCARVCFWTRHGVGAAQIWSLIKPELACVICIFYFAGSITLISFCIYLSLPRCGYRWFKDRHWHWREQYSWNWKLFDPSLLSHLQHVLETDSHSRPFSLQPFGIKRAICWLGHDKVITTVAWYWTWSNWCLIATALSEFGFHSSWTKADEFNTPEAEECSEGAQETKCFVVQKTCSKFSKPFALWDPSAKALDCIGSTVDHWFCL